jgi:hypothetical protein
MFHHILHKIMISIKYFELTIVALRHYIDSCSENIANAQKSGNVEKEKEWIEVQDMYQEMIKSYEICLNQQKNQLDENNS